MVSNIDGGHEYKSRIDKSLVSKDISVLTESCEGIWYLTRGVDETQNCIV